MKKRICNWVVFLNFINNEILRINEMLGKNENVNILFAEKHTKFGKEKFTYNSQTITEFKKICLQIIIQ